MSVLRATHKAAELLTVTQLKATEGMRDKANKFACRTRSLRKGDCCV